MDEGQLVELPDGRVLANMRTNSSGSCGCRAIAVSHDGGATFGAEGFDAALIEPQDIHGCMASILRNRDAIFFANPASLTDRQNGLVRRSDDAATTWGSSLSVDTGSYAYSCLTRMPGGERLGLLWETSDVNCWGPSCRLVFSSFAVDDL